MVVQVLYLLVNNALSMSSGILEHTDDVRDDSDAHISVHILHQPADLTGGQPTAYELDERFVSHGLSKIGILS